MGWAKYYEDNVSICVGRMVEKDNHPMIYTPVTHRKLDRQKSNSPVHPAIEYKAGTVSTSSEDSFGTERKGLELSFITSPEVRICRKLQMNGWWWSASKKCWCNFNTKVNRRYAEEMTRRYMAKITIVAA